MKSFYIVITLVLAFTGPRPVYSSPEDHDETSFNEFMEDFKSKMKMYSDGQGHYLALAPDIYDRAGHRQYLGAPVFWGNGRKMSQLPGSTLDGRYREQIRDLMFVDPEVKASFKDRRFETPVKLILKNTAIDPDKGPEYDWPVKTDGVYTVECGDKVTTYKEISAEETQKLLKNVRFVPEPYQDPSPMFAGQTADGKTYAIVSWLKEEQVLFYGKKGAPKQSPVEQAGTVWPEPEIYKAKDGALVSAPRGHGTSEGAFFISPGKKEKLPLKAIAGLPDYTIDEYDKTKDALSKIIDQSHLKTLTHHEKTASPCDPLFSDNTHPHDAKKQPAKTHKP